MFDQYSKGPVDEPGGPSSGIAKAISILTVILVISLGLCGATGVVMYAGDGNEWLWGIGMLELLAIGLSLLGLAILVPILMVSRILDSRIRKQRQKEESSRNEDSNNHGA